MAEKIPQHQHCVICAKPTHMGETVCSEECNKKYQAMIKRTRIFRYMMFGLLGLLAAAIVISYTMTG